MDRLDRIDAVRRAGARGLAAYEARIQYGRPLVEVDELEAFLGWFGMSEVMRRVQGE